MARKQSWKPPHKVGEGGWQREFPASETIWIGKEISVTVCRASGRIAVGVRAPAKYAISVGKSAAENISENLPNSSK